MIELIESTSREMLDVKVVPDLLQVIALRARLEDLDGIPVINVNDVPLQGFNSIVKRTIDIALSAAALLVLALPLGIIALLVRLTSRGPVLYRQDRMGLDGKSFSILKFRSMHDDAERETGPVWAQRNDPRVTALGELSAQVESRRAAAALERAPRRHVDCRTAAGAAAFRRAVQAPHPAVHAAAQGEGGTDRLGAGERVAGQHAAREADRIRFVLHRELVGAPRLEDHVADRSSKASSTSTPISHRVAASATAARATRSNRVRAGPAKVIMKPRVVITGSAGFIGSHLAETLLDQDYSVIGIDNLLTGDTANISHLVNRDFTFIKHDVTNYMYIEGPVDFVLHWASPASPIDYLELPIPTLKVGALGTHKALGLAKAKGATFVIASTSEVYGDPLEHPQTETYWGNVNPVGPRGVYDEAKRFAEAMTMAYHRYHDVNTKIVRIFNTYGPRMRLNDGRAVPAFMSQALRNQDVTVFGDGSQTRSFTYITDLVDGIIKLMLSDTNDPVNIGNPIEMTIKEIAETIIRMTGSTSQIIYTPLPTDDPKQRRPDITRARTILNWEPKVQLEEGLVKTIEYFRTKVTLRAPVARPRSPDDGIPIDSCRYSA